MIPLQSRLYNNSSVSDWLGTAKEAAVIGAGLLERIRDEKSAHPFDDLAKAHEFFKQALNEVETVREHLAHVAAYGERT